MKGKFLHFGGLVLLSFSICAQCQVEDFDGSGSGDITDYVDEAILHWGSGDGPTPTRSSTTSKTFNPDDEDNDDIFIFSGDESIPDMSGDGPSLGSLFKNDVKCSTVRDYCWCVDLTGREIPGTRVYAPNTHVNCDVLLHPGQDTTSNIIIIDTTAARDRTIPRRGPTTAKYPPFHMKTDAPTKHGGMSTVRGGAGKDRINSDDVERERVVPLFTHPGILAAVIGGGVVALLCALLLIMFVVYRMRKKDEGSYPIDPDAKPPRLHTYTRAPNKEFYA